MKIFLWSETYLPNLGGMETTAYTLAEEFVNQGHQVRLLTWTKANQEYDKNTPFTVIRMPSRKTMWETARWCDVCLHNGIMQAGLGPLIYYLIPLFKPWVLLHQFFLYQVKMRKFPQIKYNLFESFLTHVYLCEEMQKLAKRPGVVLGNPYRASLFREIPDLPRDRELVYLGRFISYKGVHLVIDTLNLLKERGKIYNLTLIGDGPEKQNLIDKVKKWELTKQVKFAGLLRGEELVKTLNQHKVMLAPSLWKEPFGIVALESIACGCIPITTNTGGLIDAVGPCGLTFPTPKGDVTEIARLIELVLENDDKPMQLRSHAQQHLQQYTAQNLVKKYIQLFENIT